MSERFIYFLLHCYSCQVRTVQLHNNYGPFDPKYFVASDPLAELLGADKRDLVQRIAKLDGWIEDRKKILYDNLSRIEDDICRADSDLYQVRLTHPYDPRPAEGIEKTLFGLEEQKCLERGGAWKDMWLVQKELIELMKQYRSLQRSAPAPPTSGAHFIRCALFIRRGSWLRWRGAPPPLAPVNC